MTEAEIADALRDRLNGTPSAAPIVWENAPGVWSGTEWITPDAPYWLAYQVKTPAERLGLSKTHILAGRLVVAVMVEEGTFTGETETQAQRIGDRFPVDLKLAAGTGRVQIVARPYADDGYMDGSYWRTNVHIRWRAISEGG